ncbi:hypothetical protein GQX73_g4467 [Xylaria multiplex]|uniref:Uncharacterized protein n=1 Tax=Xylaria multiplex TaxID=323545 RepID=A0A7C8IXX9_9PEZI|nr:hypothetical protein GQX73_g4467 [Xylaria multiplex]
MTATNILSPESASTSYISGNEDKVSGGGGGGSLEPVFLPLIRRQWSQDDSEPDDEEDGPHGRFNQLTGTDTSTLTTTFIPDEITTPFTTSDVHTTLATPVSDVYPPLTTLFTPDPSCLSVFGSCATDGGISSPNNCIGNVFPQAICSTSTIGLDGIARFTWGNSLSCYPSSSGAHFLVQTYSPGYFCPVGMTTVTSVLALDAVWCCPTGLTLEDDLCKSTGTQVIYREDTAVEDCLHTNTLALSTAPTMTVNFSPILLGRQKFPLTTPLTSIGSSPTSPSSSPRPPNKQPAMSETATIGIIIGSIIGGLFLSSLAILYIMKLRKAKRLGKRQLEAAVKAKPDEYTGKPELEGSRAYVYTAKAELDAMATRAELEGTVVESHGDDGIYVLKPELQGTLGTERNRGAYVRKRSELEAVPKLCVPVGEQPVGGL